MKNLLLIAALLICSRVNAQGFWTQKATLPDTVRQLPATFVIGNKGYVVTGTYFAGYSKQLWEYDAASNIWTRKADFPGNARMAATGFSIGGKGYVCCGSSNAVTVAYSDLWEYDPILDLWTIRASFPGTLRDAAIGFAIGSKGYVGTGRSMPGSPSLNDFWEYNSTTNTWTPLANVPGPPRSFAIGFTVNNKGYVGGGFGPGGFVLNDLYEFDPGSNTWATKSPTGFGNAQAGCFVIGSNVYIATGLLSCCTGDSSLWKYDPSTNLYSLIGSFAGGRRGNASAFSIAGKGYVGLGVNSSYGFPNDLYEYNPREVTVSMQEINTNEVAFIYPNPSAGLITIKKTKNSVSEMRVYNSLGELILNKTIVGEQKIDLTCQPKGIYFFEIMSEGEKVMTKLVLE